MIEIHTLGWQGDHAINGSEEPTVSVFCRVFINGVEIPGVARARTRHDADFALTTISLYEPARIVTHTKESWEALGKEGEDESFAPFVPRGENYGT